MGVDGLQSFVNNEKGLKRMNISIAQLAKEYVQRTGLKPTVLIDGNNCVNNFYNGLNSEEQFLGLYDDFKSRLKQFIQALNDNNIKFIFFFDGAPSDERQNIWAKRRNNQGKNISKTVDFIRTGGYNKERLKKEIAYNLDTAEFIRFAIRSENCEVRQTVAQADDEILKAVAEMGGHCFAVMSGDGDFIVAEGIHYVMLPNSKTTTQLTVTAIDRRDVMRRLRIDEQYLPLLATLCGNDIVDSAPLKGPICRGYTTKEQAIPKIAQWIERNHRNFENNNDYAKKVGELLQAPHLEDKIRQSINSYKLPSVGNHPTQKEEPNRDNWSQILIVGEERHRKKGTHKTVFSVLERAKYFQSCGMEIFSDINYLHSAQLLAKLRQKFYGILLKERPNSGEKFVTEFVLGVSGPTVEPIKIAPIFPQYHPGLLKLWGNAAENERFKVLFWAVSEKLKLETLLDIPSELLCSFLSLFYLKNEAKSGLTDWQLKAFIAHFLIFNTPQHYSQPDMFEIHFGSVFIRAWFNVLALNDACGNPVLEKEPNQQFFDGKKFNYVYHAIKNGNDYELDYDRNKCKYLLDQLLLGY